MKTLNIEYCHITPGIDNGDVVKEANIWMPKVLEIYKDYKVQKCIMIDDIHASEPISDKFIETLVSSLLIKPDSIYLESEFIVEARDMIKKIDNKKIDFIYSEKETWLRKHTKKYKSKTEFLLNWKNNKCETEYSCPALAAASYLARLGLIKGDGIKTLYGKKVIISDHILNVLPSFYLSVEDKARIIINSTYQEALDKISWFFY